MNPRAPFPTTVAFAPTITDPTRAVSELITVPTLVICAAVAVIVVWKTLGRKVDVATGVKALVAIFAGLLALIVALAIGYQWGYTVALDPAAAPPTLEYQP